MKRTARLSLVIVMMAMGWSIAHAQNFGDLLGGIGKQLLQNGDLQGAVEGLLSDALMSVLGGSEGAMPGDRRLADQGRGLAQTQEEQDGAQRAYAIFQQVQAAPSSEPASLFQPNTAQGTAQIGQLQKIAQQVKDGSVLSPEQDRQLRQALRPFILSYVMEQARQQGMGAVVIPPHAMLGMKFGAYCNDPSLPAPKVNEPFTLVSVDTLMPPELKPAYLGLLKIGAQMGHGHDSAIQSLIWTLRKTANGQALGQPLTLSPEQQRLLTQADPDAVTALQTYYQRAQGQRLLQDAIRAGVHKAGAALTGNRPLVSVPHSQALAEVETLTRQLEAAPISAPITGQNPGYTALNDTVAVYAGSPSGGMSTVTLAMANSGDDPAVFLPNSCIAQSTRPVQRLSLQHNEPQRVGAIDDDGAPKLTRIVWTEIGRPDRDAVAIEGYGADGRHRYWRPAKFQAALVGLCLVPPEGWIICGGGAVLTALMARLALQAIIQEELKKPEAQCGIQPVLQIPDRNSMKAPGNCTPDEQAQMQRDVKQYCNVKRGCTSSTSPAEAQENIVKINRCLQARETIHNRCFMGGDDGHRTQVDQELKSLANCQNRLNSAH